MHSAGTVRDHWSQAAHQHEQCGATSNLWRRRLSSWDGRTLFLLVAVGVRLQYYAACASRYGNSGRRRCRLGSGGGGFLLLHLSIPRRQLVVLFLFCCVARCGGRIAVQVLVAGLAVHLRVLRRQLIYRAVAVLRTAVVFSFYLQHNLRVVEVQR